MVEHQIPNQLKKILNHFSQTLDDCVDYGVFESMPLLNVAGSGLINLHSHTGRTFSPKSPHRIFQYPSL